MGDDGVLNLENIDDFVPRIMVQAKNRLMFLHAFLLGLTGGERRGRICQPISAVSTSPIEKYSRKVGKPRVSVDTPTVPSRTRKLT